LIAGARVRPSTEMFEGEVGGGRRLRDRLLLFIQRVVLLKGRRVMRLSEVVESITSNSNDEELCFEL